jgi:hypothetical protein
MTLKIEITMDTAAFDPDHGHEAGRILTHLASELSSFDALRDVGDHETLRDLNGNRVGTAKITR